MRFTSKHQILPPFRLDQCRRAATGRAEGGPLAAGYEISVAKPRGLPDLPPPRETRVLRGRKCQKRRFSSKRGLAAFMAMEGLNAGAGREAVDMTRWAELVSLISDQPHRRLSMNRLLSAPHIPQR